MSAAPRIVPGSEEEQVHAILVTGETTAQTICDTTGIPLERVRKMLTRLDEAGMARTRRVGMHTRKWSAAKRRPRANAVEYIGLASAIRRLLEQGGEHAIAELADRFGAPVKRVTIEMTKLVSGNVVARVGERGNNVTESSRYKARRSADNVRHLYGFVEGEGERRDCANYEWCLDNFKGDGDAHCAKDCAGFQVIPLERLREEARIRRRSVFDG
ncbi:hypothetical protein WMF38_56835 [Sorangium sp. So ce118]